MKLVECFYYYNDILYPVAFILLPFTCLLPFCLGRSAVIIPYTSLNPQAP